MKKPIMVIADTHLARNAWVNRPGLEGDSYYSFEQISRYCTNHCLPLLLPGDVFDKKRPDPTTIHVVNECIESMKNSNCEIIYTQGQHELDRVRPWLSAINGWPKHINHKTVNINGVAFYGLDWTHPEEVLKEFDDIPEDTDVLVAHQVWKDFMGTRIGEAECAFSDVPRVKMIITGDFHKHLSVEAHNRDIQLITVLSTGSICMQSIDENPAKKFFVLYDDLSFHSETLKTRNCFRFTINNKEELEIFLSGNIDGCIAPQVGVPELISRNIVHITYLDDIPEAHTRITSAIKGRAHLFMVPVRHRKDKVSVDVVARREMIDKGLSACLELIVDPKSPKYRDLVSLLDSDNPAGQLELLHESYVKQKVKV